MDKQQARGRATHVEEMAPPIPPPRNGRSVKIVLEMLLFLIGNALNN